MRLRKIKKPALLLALGICLWPATLQAQKASFNGWLFSSHEQKLSEKWALLSDIQVRSSAQWKSIETILLRPAVQYAFNKKWSAALGYVYFGNWLQDEGGDYFELEHRIWQQLLVETGWGNAELTNRLRLEQRFLEGDDGFDFAQRARYYIRFKTPLQKDGTKDKGLFAAVQNELFLNVQHKEKINKKVFDQNRFYTGLGYAFSKALELEGGFMYRYQIETEKTHTHIFQVTISTAL